MPDIEFRLTAKDEATPVIEQTRKKLDEFNTTTSKVDLKMPEIKPPDLPKVPPLTMKVPKVPAMEPGGMPPYQPEYRGKIDALIGDFFGTFKKMLPAGMAGAMPEMGKEGVSGAAGGGEAARGAAGGAASGAMMGVGLVALAGAVKMGMDKIADFARKIWQITIEAAPQLKGTLQWIYDMLALSLYPIGQAMATALIPIAESLTKLTSDILVKFGDVNIEDTEELANYFAETFKAYVDFFINDVLPAVVPAMISVLTALVAGTAKVLHDYGGQFVSAIGDGLEEAGFTMERLGNMIWEWVRPYFDRMANILTNKMIEWAAAVVPGEIKRIMGGLWGIIAEMLPGLGGELWSRIIGALSNIGSWLEGIGPWIARTIMAYLGNFPYEVYKSFHNILAAIPKAIRNIELPLIGKPFTFIPDVPYLAGGGVITQPTLAMLGEKGAEAVVPLKGGGQGMPAPTVINNFYAPIYGVDDLEKAFKDIMNRQQMGYATYR